MGSLCSKLGSHSGGHTLLSVSDVNNNASTQAGRERPNLRSAAAEAAELRRKAEQSRGTQASNPQRGILAAELQASKATSHKVPEPRQDDRLVWD